MRVLTAFLLMLFVFTGCTGSAENIEPGLTIRNKLVSGNGCSFETTITADYGDEIYTFSMKCEVDQNGNLSFAVTEPDSIKGICGTVSESGGSLSFDDQMLAFEMLADGMISPVITPWLLIRSLRSGYISGTAKESGGTCLHIDDSFKGENLKTIVWINPEGEPTGAEFLYKGKRILSLNVVNFLIL